MIKKNEKGFALVLSLVLLMAMTLMGGALIVISASDHRSNNVGDEYQQTFYVAETALYEGEKYVLNQYLGPHKTNGDRDLTKRNLPANHTVKFNPDTSNVKDCFYSFPDIDSPTFNVLLGPSPANPVSTTKEQINESKSLLYDSFDFDKNSAEFRLYYFVLYVIPLSEISSSKSLYLIE